MKKGFVPIVVTGAIAAVAVSGVIVHYEPTELIVGETVDLTISLSSDPGTDAAFSGVAFEYEPDSPAWAALNPSAFEWINEEMQDWFLDSTLPEPTAVVFGSQHLTLLDGEVVAIGALTVTPTAVGVLELASNLRVLAQNGAPLSVGGDDPVTIVVTSSVCAAAGFSAPAAGVSFAQGAWDGYIDARRESADGATLIGLDTITIQFTTAMENNDGSPQSADAFTVADTADTPPLISGVEVDGRTVTLHLSGPITPQEWTTLSVSARSRCPRNPSTVSSTSDTYPPTWTRMAASTPLDLLRFKQYVSGVSVPPVGVVEDYVDTDRSGRVNPLDRLAYKQLVNGITPPATQPWAGACLPAQP